MKKSLFLIPCLAAALWSCSDKDVVGPNEPGQVEFEKSYLAVNLNGVQGFSSRAGEVFEDGTSDEYAVESIRFFFFKNSTDGSSNYPVATVVGGSSYYYDTTPQGVEADGDKSDDIEANVNAMIVLNTQKTSNPSGSGADVTEGVDYILAVLNPSDAFKTKTNSGITNYADLLAKTDVAADLYEVPTTGAPIPTNFVMSNSVFYEGATDPNNGLVSIAGHVKQTQLAALEDPVTIYVEREAAKATLEIKEGVETNKGYIKLQSDADGTAIQLGGKDLYVDILGWNVTATADKSFVVKNLNSNWFTSVSTTPFSGWTDGVVNHRSYWAVNPSDPAITYEYSDFNVTEGESANGYPLGSAVYMTENAFEPGSTPNYEPTDPTTPTTTKIIVAAQIVDEDGTAIPIVEYGGGTRTAFDENTLLQSMAEHSNIYVRYTRPGGGVFRETRLNTNDLYKKYLTLVSNQNLGEEVSLNPNVSYRNYYTYVQFKDQGEGNPFETLTDEDGNEISFLLGVGHDAPVISTLAEFNQHLIDNVGYAKIWKQGYTYYFFDIKHVNTAGAPSGDTPAQTGYYGVIRNHWYDAQIAAVYGLGTPVFDPDDVIYPQTPEDDPFTYVAAEIKILSWRKVSQGEIELGN